MTSRSNLKEYILPGVSPVCNVHNNKVWNTQNVIMALFKPLMFTKECNDSGYEKLGFGVKLHAHLTVIILNLLPPLEVVGGLMANPITHIDTP